MLQDKSIHLDHLTLGTCYYPEHWPKTMWADDLRRMKAAGIETVRVFEFAWSIVEPRENQWDFALFDEFLNLAKDMAMQVIMCTPTATPPAWMSHNYPEILNVKMNGEVIHHGHRRHNNYTSSKYLFFVERVTKKLAERYGDHPAVIGWQIDNEVNCEIDAFYAPSDRAAFRAYLKERFGTLEKLNEAIGATFWNQTYDSWDQVDMERTTIHNHANPHLALLEKEFISCCAIRYVKLQADILRQHSPQRYVTTNGIFSHIDNVEMTQTALDFMTYDSYPNFAYGINSEKVFQSPLKDRMWSMMLSSARELSPNFGVMEQQSGAGGWDFRMLAPMPRPGQLRLWAYQSIANGADYVSFFRWRTCSYGTEIYWHGINDYDNRDNRRLREVTELHQELTRLPEVAGSRYEAGVALMTDYLNAWDGERDQWHGNLDRASQLAIYQAAIESHTPMDMIHLRKGTTLQDLQKYGLIFYPHPTILTEEAAHLLQLYVNQGGKVVLGARTGYKDETGRCPMMPMPGHAAPLCGMTVKEYTFAHPNEAAVTIRLEDGTALPGPIFHDVLEVAADAEVLGTFQGSFYSGEPAWVLKKAPSGGWASYFGAGFSVESAVALMKLAGVHAPFSAQVALPAGCELAVRRSSCGPRYYFLLNYEPTPQTCTIHMPMTNMVTGEGLQGEVTLPPYGVLVCKD